MDYIADQTVIDHLSSLRKAVAPAMRTVDSQRDLGFSTRGDYLIGVCQGVSQRLFRPDCLNAIVAIRDFEQDVFPWFHRGADADNLWSCFFQHLAVIFEQRVDTPLCVCSGALFRPSVGKSDDLNFRYGGHTADVCVWQVPAVVFGSFFVPRARDSTESDDCGACHWNEPFGTQAIAEYDA